MSISHKGSVLFAATLVRGHIAKFHIPYLQWFKEQGWETWVAAKNDYPDGVCNIPYCDHFVNIDFDRSPFSRQTLVAYAQLRKLFASQHFDIVHVHTPVGGVLARLAARNRRAQGTQVVYTAHGFHFYRGAPLKNWVLWYPVERLMTRYTDVLITINHEDYVRAQKFAHCHVEYVPGVGIDLRKFGSREKSPDVRSTLGVGKRDYVLLSVGDLIPRKNQAAIIRSLSLLPEHCRLLICGVGPERENLAQLAEEMGVSDRVTFLGFRNDIAEIMSVSDCLVFPSIHEGLPVSVMEAMASGLPVIASAIRGISPDLIENGKNGLLLRDDSPDAIAECVVKLMESKSMASEMATRAASDAQEFGIDRILGRETRVYNMGRFDGSAD